MIKRLAGFLSRRSRIKKYWQFLRIMAPTAQSRVLDVGVANSGHSRGPGSIPENFFEVMYPWPDKITAVGMHDFSRFSPAFPGVTCVTADGRHLPFADQSFDIVFSNAVVEHVGDLADQQAFVRELCRVGKRVFITTPNLCFPIETHTLLPCVHWLPKPLRDSIFRRFGKAHSCHVRLLSPTAFRNLFPTQVRIINNVMTLIAVSEEVQQ